MTEHEDPERGSARGQALLQREEDGWRVCEFTG